MFEEKSFIAAQAEWNAYVVAICTVSSALSAEYESNQMGMIVANPAHRGQLKWGNEISLCPFVPENLVSRDDRFDRPFPRQPAAHSPHSG